MGGGNAGQQLRHQIALAFEIDAIEARPGLADPPQPRFARALEGAAFEGAAQGIEKLPGKVSAQPVRVEVADQVGAHFEPVGALAESCEITAVRGRRFGQRRDEKRTIDALPAVRAISFLNCLHNAKNLLPGTRKEVSGGAARSRLVVPGPMGRDKTPRPT